MAAAAPHTPDAWGPLHHQVRPARPDDVARLMELILELAAYERAADQVRSTEAQLQEALFGADRAAYALVAVAPAARSENEPAVAGPGAASRTDPAGEPEVVGFALWFRNFSTWTGTYGIYLEDLYVVPEHRSSGLGGALLRSLATIAVRSGYARFEWSVLDWNTPAIDFYRALGAEPMSEWTVQRLTGPALRAAALPGTSLP